MDATPAQQNDPIRFMTEQVTLYNCHRCSKIFNGGKYDFDGALRENMDPENFLCKPCGEKELGYGTEHCD